MRPGWEWVLVLLVFLLLFGYKRLPDATRSVGRSLRIFKAETRGMRDDDERASVGPADQTPRQRELAADPRSDVSDGSRPSGRPGDDEAPLLNPRSEDTVVHDGSPEAVRAREGRGTA